MIFEYDSQKAFQKSIDVVDIGNTALKCMTNSFEEYYIVLKTILGKTHILKCGPVIADLEAPIDGLTISYKKIDYRENLIVKEVNQLINDAKKGITDIEEITEYEALQSFPEINNLWEVIQNGLD